VLWFQQGDDSRSASTGEKILSAKTDGIFIAVASNEQHINNATL
jgi:hypothetical protein